MSMRFLIEFFYRFNKNSIHNISYNHCMTEDHAVVDRILQSVSLLDQRFLLH
jgi:hypothetical protein